MNILKFVRGAEINFWGVGSKDLHTVENPGPAHCKLILQTIFYGSLFQHSQFFLHV